MFGSIKATNENEMKQNRTKRNKKENGMEFKQT